MKADWTLHKIVNATNLDQIYMVYECEPHDAVMVWLHEGLAHECSYVWQRRFQDPLRPFKTVCGIHVVLNLDKVNDQLFNLVNVTTTCVWCIAGRKREE